MLTKRLVIGLSLASAWIASIASAQIQLPAIDPSGQRILLPPPNYTTLNSTVDPSTGRHQFPLIDKLFHKNNQNQTAESGSRQGFCPNKGRPAFTTPPQAPPCETEGIMPNTPRPVPYQMIPYGPVAPRVIVPGKCQDPKSAAQDSNKGLFGHTVQSSHPQSVVSLNPRRQIAPVGSEVVLIGGICDGSGYYQTRSPVEWTLSQGSVGHFVDPGRAQVGKSPIRGRLGDLFAEPFAELLSNNYALGQTSRKVQVLTRGTPKTDDDLIVESGQTWIGVSSPVEGATYITIMAPYLDGWEQRTQSAEIHWIDGQWTFPRPAIVQGIQPHTLTTRVLRKVTSGPIMNWIVRYEIQDAVAQFENGSTVREVLTDSTGEASLRILPIVPTGGSTQVKVQVIRPPRAGERDPLVLGEEMTRVTWTTSQVAVRISGPESVELNDNATYTVTVSNPGTLAADNVRVQAMVPTGFLLLSVSPIGQQVGSRLDWTIAQLKPGEEQVFEIAYRAAQSGTARHCVNVQASGGAPLEDCLTTQVTADSLYIEMVEPNPELPIQVGQNIEYQVTVKNRGDRPLTDVVVSDRFDEGLSHQQGAGPIEWPIGRLEANQSRQLTLSFQIVQQGKHCHTVEATATGTPPARASACVFGAPEPRRDLTVRKRGPTQMAEGETAEIQVLLENTGDVALTNLQIVDQFGPEFRPLIAKPAEQSSERNRITWYLTRLEPGERREFSVSCQALFGNVNQACSNVVVGSADGVQRTAEHCVQITPGAGRSDAGAPPFAPPPETGLPPRGAMPSPGASGMTGGSAHRPVSQIMPGGPVSGLGNGLEITVETGGEHLSVGDRIDYVVTLRNNRSVADKDVVMTMRLPQQTQLKNYSGPVTAKDHSNDWRTIEMAPIRALRPGETVRFTISVVVDKAGHLQARAEARSAKTPQGVAGASVAVANG